MRRETIKFWDLVHLILEIWQHVHRPMSSHPNLWAYLCDVLKEWIHHHTPHSPDSFWFLHWFRSLVHQSKQSFREPQYRTLIGWTTVDQLLEHCEEPETECTMFPSICLLHQSLIKRANDWWKMFGNLINFSLKSIPVCLIDDKSTMFQIIAWGLQASSNDDQDPCLVFTNHERSSHI